MLIASLIILQVLIFAGLIFMLRKIMTQNVVSATRHIEELNQDYLKKEEEVTRRLSEVQLQAEEMLNKARKEADDYKAEITRQTEAQRQEIIKQARQQGDEIIQQAEKSRQALLSELDERISKEAINKACELIQYAIPDKFKLDVHTHWVEELIENDFGRFQNLRLPEDIQEVKIITAFSLSEQQRKALSRKIKEVFNRDISLKEEVDPKVCAGLIITMGSLVLDGSLRNKVQEKAKIVQSTIKE